MKDLIEALQIFVKYGDPYSPTHCEHDIMYVCIDPALVSLEDMIQLEKLGFEPDKENTDCFSSFRYGRA